MPGEACPARSPTPGSRQGTEIRVPPLEEAPRGLWGVERGTNLPERPRGDPAGGRDVLPGLGGTRSVRPHWPLPSQL